MTPATVFEPRRTNYLKLKTVPFYEFNPLYIGPSALFETALLAGYVHCLM
jgi:hypothetical protein